MVRHNPANANHAVTKAPISMSNDTQLDTLRGTILAVDDSPTIRKLVSMTMESQGYRVVVAADGIEALATLKQEHPDLILCDIAMPKLDGYQLCKIIKNSNDTKHIPVVMLSGKDGLFDRVRGKMAGCANYITKPFEPDLLISEVKKYVKPALIPMSPHKPKKKTPAPGRPAMQTDTDKAPAGKTPPAQDARPLSEQLAGIELPEAGHAATTSRQVANTRPAPQAAKPIPLRADDLPPLPDEPPPEIPPRAATTTATTKTATTPPEGKTGTIEFDKLLSEIERDKESPEPERPSTPFRSRCPGCRTIFKNVRPENYDKHARCKKCNTRFHLGNNLVA